ncbi:MAG: ATP-binding protein, partial [Candidatus Electrothrix sp. AR4]|nr:ATP-binding protein [Candidatus Electrothrix sp. AR4]
MKRWGGKNALHEALSLWTEQLERPLILLIDEIDSLVGDTLISVLRQLRSGYTDRSSHFPQSVVLCGVRDIRDYRIHSDQEEEIITGGSAFNIKAVSLRLGDFSREETERLYRLHTTATGQVFADNVLDAVWELTEGQPWLVNALAYEVCFNTKANRDRSVVITPEMIRRAGDNLILRRETHLDQLADKLREERVRRVVAPILYGAENPKNIPPDGIMYAEDLG